MSGVTLPLCLIVTFTFVVIFPVFTSGSHFRGGIISWRPLSQPSSNQTNILPPIEISFRVAWRRNSGGHFCTADDITSRNLLRGEGSLSCTSRGSCLSLSYVCTDFNEIENWSTGINSGQFQPTIPVFDIWFSGCCWISLRNGGSSWDLGALVNLTVRSDTGLINSSPTTTTMPIVRFQRECNNTIQIPVSDPDGDYVRCFWASRRCGGICNRLPGAFLNEDTCELFWNVDEGIALGLYGVAIEIEDYASPSSTDALSVIPLQFLVDLFSSSETCVSQPVFIPPTRAHDSCIGISENTTYHEPIVARTGSVDVSILDIDTVSPAGVSKSAVAPFPGGLSNDYHVNITWTPDTVGFQELLCFTPRDNVGSVGIQSCVTLVTGTDPPQINTSSLLPAPGDEVLPSDLVVQMTFDQEVIRPTRSAIITLFDETDTMVYQQDSSLSEQVSFIDNSILEFTIPGRILEEKISYYILMDPGVVKSTTFCGVESPAIRDRNFWRFTIRDITPPVLNFVNVPPRTNANATILWSVNEASSATCTLSSPTGTNIVPCGESWSGVFLSEGYHTLYVTATDTSGNVGRTRSVSWFVDRTAPTVDIYQRPNEVSNETVATFSFRCTRFNEFCQFRCGHSINNTEPNLQQCVSPYVASGLLNDMQYTFSIVATDSVGNTAEEVSIPWIVDTEPPSVSSLPSIQVTCGMPFDASVTGVPTSTDNQDAAPRGSFVDEPLSNCTFVRTWTFTDEAGNTAIIRQSLFIDNVSPPQVNVPLLRVLACSDDFEAELDIMNSRGESQVSHPCDRPLVVSFTDDLNAKRCGIAFTRFWTVADDCGNIVGVQQRIQILELQLPESPMSGQVNVELNAMLRWPSYPGASSHNVYVWRYEDTRPDGPTEQTNGLTYIPSTPYPPSTRMLWQVEYVLGEGTRRKRQDNEITIIPSPVWGFVTRSFPDLTVTDINVPSIAFSGQNIEVSWQVENIGQMGVPFITWFDRVHLSLLPEPESNPVVFRNQRVRRFVDPVDGYSITTSWTLPEDFIGTFHVFVETDVFSSVEDFDRSNNVGIADSTVEVRLTPPPDLQVTSVVAPASTFSGLNINVRWKVENLGFGVTSRSEWFDRIYFSSDSVLDRQDRLLLSILHTGILTVGTGYSSSATVSVPTRTYGDHFIIVATDVFNNIYEHSFENNNDLNSSSINVILSPPADLEVTNITVQPDPAKSGDVVTVSWEVFNRGGGFPDSFFWYDRVVLLFGDQRRTISLPYVSEDLPPLTSYARSVPFTVSGSQISGIYQISVETDVFDSVFEFNAEENNNLVYDLQIEQSLPDLRISDAMGIVSTNETTGEITLTLNWTVTNTGEAATFKGSITDSVHILGSSSRFLGSTVFNDVLLPDQSYNVIDEEFAVPNDVRGKVQIRILTDASARHVESGPAASNEILLDLDIPCLEPNFAISDVEILTRMPYRAGDYVEISWEVANIGSVLLRPFMLNRLINIMRFSPNYEIRLLKQLETESEVMPMSTTSRNVTVQLPSDIRGNVSLSVVYEFNNVAPCPSTVKQRATEYFVIQSPPTPNLQVTNISWSPLEVGQSILVNWTVTNIGNTMISESQWYDEVVLVPDLRNNGDNSVRLGLFSYNGIMEFRQSYTNSKPLLVPQNLGGSLYISVITTFELVPTQSISEDQPVNVLGRSSDLTNELLELPEPSLPDLVVRSISEVPSNASFGSVLAVYYEVENVGSSTLASSWTDCIYIVQPVLRLQVQKIIHTGSLNSRDSYRGAIFFRIPFVLNDLAQIEVTVDATLQVRDSNRENNVASSGSINLYEGPMGDLTVTIDTRDTQLFPGAPISFNYSLTNIGAGTIEGFWIDSIYLSQDINIDPFDIRLSSSQNGGIIGQNETLQVNTELSVPFDLPVAVFYVIVVTDSRNEIFEQNDDNNQAAMAFEISGGFLSDLSVTSVNNPASVSFGDNLGVDWVVENLGLEMVEGYKCDAVYLSDDREWQVMDTEVGRTCTFFTLSSLSNAPLNGEMFSFEAPLPLVSSGKHYAIVRSRSNIRDLNLENNICIGDTGLEVSLPLLEVEVPVSAVISLYESLAYRIPAIPADETLVVDLTSASEFDVNNLFLSYDEIATASNFDAASEESFSPNQTVILSPTRQGDYYLLIQNNGALENTRSGTPSTIFLSARIARFEILDVRPKAAAPLGNVTLSVRGTVFPEIISAKLRGDDGAEISAQNIFRFSSQELYVTFNMIGNDIGSSFDLILNDEVEFLQAIRMKSGVEGTITVSVNNPGRLRPFEVGQVLVDVRNTGDTDILTPLMVFTISEQGEARLVGSGPSSNWLNSQYFFPSPSRGPAGIIPPGSLGRFVFEVRSLSGTGSVELSLSTVSSEGSSTPNLFVDEGDYFRPFMLSDESWGRVWEMFLEVTGPTHETFTQQMSKVLNHLSLVGERPRLVEEVVLHQVNLVDGFGYYTAFTTEHVDIEVPSTENGILSLEYSREIDRLLTFRTVSGVFGRGWRSFWWNIRINILEEEETIILEQDNQFFEFIYNDAEDSYLSYRGAITKNNTELLYRDAFLGFDGLIVFDATSFALKRITTTEDQTALTFETNDANLPVLVTSSRGASLSISYTPNGLVELVELNNREGNINSSASYTYDRTGTYLMSVSVDGKVISYTYAFDGALASFTDSNGVTTSFSYNSYGLISKVSVVDTADEIIAETEINDLRDGRVTQTAYPSGLTTDSIYNLLGSVGFYRANGRPAYKLIENIQSGSATILVGDHVIRRVVYDAERNIHFIFNGNGEVLEVSKNSSTRFNYVVDGNGNRYDYDYDVQSRVRSITFADGSAETTTFDENGFVVEQRNRKGSVSSFVNDEDGLVRRRTQDDGEEYFFMYNERGLVTEATNSVGTIRISYTSTGKPRTVRYPDGKMFTYDYDEKDRRVGIRDGEDYNVTYTYDIRDRVIKVTASGNTVVDIEYDTEGRIGRKIFPNGCESSYQFRQGSSEVTQVVNSCNSSVLSQFDYGLNTRDLVSEINTTAGAWKIRYDGAEQITSWDDPQGNEINIGYDKNGNRRLLDNNGDISSYTVNNLNQYEQVGSVAIRYDENGNIISIDDPSNPQIFEFNELNHLIRSQTNDVECVYRYNAMGSLHDKECSGEKTFYYMDFFGDFGPDVLIESTETADTLYYHASGLGLLSRRTQGSLNFYNFDGTGSIVEIIGEDRALIASFSYDPFGNIIMQSGSRDSLYQFSGRYGVLTMTESGLHFMRTRFYSSQLGRFISPDLFGVFGSPSNLYLYANNNPLKYVDPFGTVPVFLAPIVPGLVAIAKGAAISAGASAAVYLATTPEITLGGLAGSLVGGAVSGAYSPVGIPGKIAVGFLGGFVGDVVTQKIDKPDEFRLDNALISGLVSGLFSSAAIIDDVPGLADITEVEAMFLAKYFDGVYKALPQMLLSQALQNLRDTLRDNYRDLWNDVLDWIESRDPNDILGPPGFGEARFIAADSCLDYRIRFENEANATAPAQLVTITTSLDEDVDMATFQLGDFGFGNFTFDSNSRSAILQNTIEFEDERSYVVRVTAGLDFQNMRATWEMQTLDPETGLPPTDPGVGFLPPNPENGTDGEGYVTYSVKLRRNVKTYDVIDAEATIVFDKNEPITTEPIFNTIDRDVPSSENVTVIDDVIDSGILALSVNSNDEGAGVRYIHVYNNDGGNLKLITSRPPTEEIITLDVPAGAIYNLVILPEDNVGNMASLSNGGESLEVYFPAIEVSCEGVNNCSGFGQCTNTNLCQCIEGRYGDDCSQVTPPVEPPIIDVAIVPGEEDMALPFPVTVELLTPTPIDAVELRLIDVLSSFTSTSGAEDGNDLLVPVAVSRDIILQPFEDLAGEFSISVRAAFKDKPGSEISRTVDIPVTVIPVPDEPSISIETACFDASDVNGTFTMYINVTSGDEDQSELVSVHIEEMTSKIVTWFPNVTMSATQISVNFTIEERHVLDTFFGVIVYAESREVSNPLLAPATSRRMVTVPLCDSEEFITTKRPAIPRPPFSIDNNPVRFG
ncbi:Teneurin-3 [Holothuria leucospilota]|uniref:Teneurin-3 n=1 Tax=Holothuria leucospilota TaxID=206669 RepID=A0A9Q0YME3_HOLLE|nr:Teneurin-3 [Holothuria leucospilota]